MINQDEAVKTAEELVQFLSINLSESDTSSINLVLSILLHKLISKTRESKGKKEAAIMLDKHHQFVDLFSNALVQQILYGENNEPESR